MLDKLATLPIDTLFKLKAQVDAMAEQRRREVFRVGRLVTFPDKQGVTLTGKIQKVGPKNLVIQVLNERGHALMAGGKWRCAPSYCQPVFGDPFAKKPGPPIGVGNDKPAYAGAGAF